MLHLPSQQALQRHLRPIVCPPGQPSQAEMRLAPSDFALMQCSLAVSTCATTTKKVILILRMGFWKALIIAEDALPESNIPECLMFPSSEQEPVLSPEELSRVDAVAMRFEVDRLSRIPALEQVPHMLPDHKRLTTRFVTTWRCKSIGGQTYWLRHARLVARDFAFLCPNRTDLFSPAYVLQTSTPPSGAKRGQSTLVLSVH